MASTDLTARTDWLHLDIVPTQERYAGGATLRDVRDLGDPELLSLAEQVTREAGQELTHEGFPDRDLYRVVELYRFDSDRLLRLIWVGVDARRLDRDWAKYLATGSIPGVRLVRVTSSGLRFTGGDR